MPNEAYRKLIPTKKKDRGWVARRAARVGFSLGRAGGVDGAGAHGAG
jgi:hypothetical protein